MFHSNIQDALKANHDILDLVVPGDTINSINVSRDGLSHVIEGTSQVGTVKVFFGRNPGNTNTPHLVSGGRPINETKRDVFGYYMRTDGVLAHVSHWILKSSGGNADNSEVEKIGPTYGQNRHMHQINILIQQKPTDDLVLLKT